MIAILETSLLEPPTPGGLFVGGGRASGAGRLHMDSLASDRCWPGERPVISISRLASDDITGLNCGGKSLSSCGRAQAVGYLLFRPFRRPLAHLLRTIGGRPGTPTARRWRVGVRAARWIARPDGD